MTATTQSKNKASRAAAAIVAVAIALAGIGASRRTFNADCAKAPTAIAGSN